METNVFGIAALIWEYSEIQFLSSIKGVYIYLNISLKLIISSSQTSLIVNNPLNKKQFQKYRFTTIYFYFNYKIMIYQGCSVFVFFVVVVVDEKIQTFYNLIVFDGSSKGSDKSTRDLLFQWSSTIKFQIQRVVPVQSEHNNHLIECSLFSPWYGRKKWSFDIKQQALTHWFISLYIHSKIQIYLFSFWNSPKKDNSYKEIRRKDVMGNLRNIDFFSYKKLFYGEAKYKIRSFFFFKSLFFL